MKEKLKQFTIRLNEKDHKNLIEQAKYLGISQAELLRELLRKNMISDIKDYNIFLDELRRDVRTLTNNVNQIAKKVNSDIFINELEEANKLREEITKIWQLLR
ncbi:plasmid mobilization relaxosome protein MobC [Fusobacterium sp. SB021]|uniref:plasmid mobilization protein n=1 Tax=Fusobacterium sp. SB021 TaxID=2744227 RepID=UPI003CF0EE8B